MCKVPNSKVTVLFGSRPIRWPALNYCLVWQPWDDSLPPTVCCLADSSLHCRQLKHIEDGFAVTSALTVVRALAAEDPARIYPRIDQGNTHSAAPPSNPFPLLAVVFSCFPNTVQSTDNFDWCFRRRRQGLSSAHPSLPFPGPHSGWFFFFFFI